MPKVPLITTQQVKQEALPNVRLNTRASPDAFGANIAAAIEGVGNVAGQIALNEFNEQNKAKAKELEVNFSKSARALLFDPENGYFNKKGEYAFQYQPVAEKAVDELIKQTIDNAETPQQKSMLMQSLSVRAEKMKLDIQRHAAKEYEAWKDAASKARIDDSIEEAAASYENPEYVNLLIETGRNEIYEMAQRGGQDAEQTNAQLKEYQSKLRTAIIDRMMLDDPKRAEAYFKEYKDEIGGRDQTAILRKLKIAKYGDLATDWGDYAELMDMSINDRSKFLTVDLNKYQLSAKHMSQMINLQRTVAGNQAKADEQVRGIGEAMSLAKASLAAAGIKMDAKAPKAHRELVQQFQGALLREIDAYRNANDGRFPSEPDVKGMIDSLLIKGTYPDDRTLGFILPDKEGYVFQGPDDDGKVVLVPYDEIPEDHRSAIKKALDAAGKSSDELSVRKIYTQKKIIEVRERYK